MENNNQPVLVTGEERRHPAIRLLARACIELARLRLRADQPTKEAANKVEAANQPLDSDQLTQPADMEQEGDHV
jgi:hypothetical protein